MPGTSCLLVKITGIKDVEEGDVVLAGIRCYVKKGKLFPVHDKFLRVADEINEMAGVKNGVVVIKKERNGG
jgi:hypothetical protein